MGRRNKGWLVGVAVVAGLIVVAGSISQPSANLAQASLPPGGSHLLGTTPDGRDLLLLCFAAMVRAVGESLWATALTVLVGVLVGLAAGELVGGVFDRVQGVAAKLLDCLGPFLIAACLASVAPRLNSWKLACFLAVIAWPNVSAVVRSEALAISKLAYVEAARAVGVSPFGLAMNHYLPAMLDRLAPLCFGLFGVFIALYGALQFVGVGIATEQGLGFLLFDAQSFIRSAPWYWMSCFGAFVVLLLGAAGAAHLARRANRSGVH
jgi:ABC-type dipeptide/oligopeptide/nickel transport system permease subunit